MNGASVSELRVPSASAFSGIEARWVLSAVVAWGALSFGAVYPWAYGVLAVVCLAAGFIGILASRGERTVLDVSLLVALAAIAVGIACQLLPLPIRRLEAISPNSLAALRQLDPAVANGVTAHHAISLYPLATLTALFLFIAFAVLFVGSTRWLSMQGAWSTVEILGIVGVGLALIAIVQKPLYTGKIYGLWRPESEGSPFGPFVNKNHFAGWMLMTVPLVLGYVCAGLERFMRGRYEGWRDRLLWFASHDANRLILAASAAGVMSLSLVLTMSRSGISALSAAILVTSLFAVRHRIRRSIRATIIAYLGVLFFVVVAWAGADAVAARFSSTDWSEFNNRGGAWADAASIFRAFPLSGTGLNTYGYATLLYQRHYLNEHFAEAHNDYLQLAAEGGLLLLIPIAATLVLFVRAVYRGFLADERSSVYWIRVGAVTALIAIAIQETVDFSLQMPGNAALFGIVCAIAAHRRGASAGSHANATDHGAHTGERGKSSGRAPNVGPKVARIDRWQARRSSSS